MKRDSIPDEMGYIKVLFFGDLVGRNARSQVKQYISDHSASYPSGSSLIIANVENSAGGFGVTKKVYDDLYSAGVNVFTGGNHIWDKSEMRTSLKSFPKLSFPVNLPRGMDYAERDTRKPYITTTIAGRRVTVLNIAGRVFMQEDTECPFKYFDKMADDLADDIVIVDFHAEATSEKAAFAEYTAGRVAAVLGTHTHVQTSDERILSDGTFFITDVGACCTDDSIIGMEKTGALERFTGGEGKLRVAINGAVKINAIELVIDAKSGKVKEFTRIYLKI